MKRYSESEAGVINWLEVDGTKTHSGFCRQGDTRKRTLLDGTEEIYSPYDELIAEEKTGKIKIKRKTKKEKDKEAREAQRAQLKRERDAALQAIQFDLGGGKFVQVRPQDVPNYQIALSRTTDPIDWVLSDNSVEALSIDILSQALAFGIDEGERIWSIYTTKLKGI